MWADFDGRGSVTEFYGGIPPPPQIFGVKGLPRNSPQNPSSKELRGQNLDNKGLRASCPIGRHRSRLGHNRLISRGWEGWMSHGWCGKFSAAEDVSSPTFRKTRKGGVPGSSYPH